MQNRILLFLLFALYLAFHLYTLNLFPLPWFDETFFASIAYNFAETGRFVPGTASVIMEDRELFLHGPLYYLMGAISFKLFGFGVFQFRIINFLFGLALIFLTARLFRSQYKASDLSIPLFLLATFLLDPFTNLVLHEGRMDLVAMFFIIACIFILLKGLEGYPKIYFLFSGLYGVLGVLTSPRPAFILAIVLLIFMVSAFRQGFLNALVMLWLWVIPFIVFYGLWVWYAFGDIGGLLAYYGEISEGKHTVDRSFIGGRFYIPRQEYLLIGIAVIAIIYGVIMKGKEFLDNLMLISIFSIISFYIVVRDLGPYSALILPFYYLVIFKSFNISGRLTFKNPAVYLMVMLFVFNSAFFLLKGMQMLAQRKERNPEVAESFIADNIPAGSRVVGDPLYYYAVKKAGSDYQYSTLFGELEEREYLLREEYQYEYMIVSEHLRTSKPHIPKLFYRNSELEVVATMISGQNKFSRAISRLNILSEMEKDGYSAVIYKRIKSKPPLHDHDHGHSH
ncbi:MAG: ArnT family glycosyltransferase [Cytophagaceae bacterium]